MSVIGSGLYVDVTAPEVSVTVIAPSSSVDVNIPMTGPPGPTGASAYVHTQTTAAATWTIGHPIGRVPAVQVSLDSGETVDTDVSLSSTQVVITFPAPTSGVAVLT